MAKAKTVVIGVGITVVGFLAIMVAMGSTMASESNTILNNNSMQIQQQVQASETQYVRIGQTVVVDDLVYNVTHVREIYNRGIAILGSGSSGASQIEVRLRIENPSKEPMAMPSLRDSFLLYDDQDRSFYPIFWDRSGSGALGPGLKTTAEVVFEVPSSTTTEYALFVGDNDSKDFKAVVWLGAIPEEE